MKSFFRRIKKAVLGEKSGEFYFDAFKEKLNQ